jgi:vacuolar protein sorting-associated protein 1
MSKITDALVQSYNSVSNLWNNEKINLNLIENKEILEIGNILNSIFINKDSIEIPRLVVVGSQSSGKSSLLNSIIGMDILPTGTDMVTRVPLQLELVQSKSNSNKAQFGNYLNGVWNTTDELVLSYPDITCGEKKNILDKINSITIKTAGKDMNISSKPIFLRIYNPSIPNLSFIDLPGLTMVACTDRGQPIDIKEKIREIVGEYIRPKKTIILAVMPARTDIEADVALDIIKEYDPNGERTIGILTKVDLMNEDTDITHLLENKVSKDLQLKYKYFAIKNRSKNEMTKYNAVEGLELEKDYFKSHKIYSHTKYQKNVGIASLCNSLSSVLIHNIKTALPKIIKEIEEKLEINNELLLKLGTSIPKATEDKFSFAHDLITKFHIKFTDVLKNKGNIINTGRTIKDILIKYRKSLYELEPFSTRNTSNQYILEAIRNSEGNHMSSESPPIDVLERVLNDKNKRYIYKIYEPSKKCVIDIIGELISLCGILIDDLGIITLPNLADSIKNRVVTILYDLNSVALKHIELQLDYQQNYIWTDDEGFKNSLHNTVKKNQGDTMRHLLERYYYSIVGIVSDTVPKCIIFYIVEEFLRKISTDLYKIIKEDSIDILLKEFDNIAEDREHLHQSNEDLTKALSLIKSILTLQ